MAIGLSATRVCARTVRGQGQAGERACFVAGTLVLTASGEVPVDEVEPGDLVWAWDTVRDTWCLAEVDRTFVHAYEGDVIAIAVGEGTIESTGNHPFWVVTGENLADRPAAQHVGPEESPLTNRGRWVDARDLRAGDLLRSRQGGHTVVASISTRQEELTVYNIAVAGHRTYAVGRCGALVHNKTTDAEGGGGASSKPARGGVVEQPRDAFGRFAPKSGNEVAPGSAAESAAWDAIAAKLGWEVVRGRVYVTDASGQTRVYDGYAKTPSGRIIGLEVKSGSGKYTAAQRAFDANLNSSRGNTATGIGQHNGVEVERAQVVRP